MARQNFMVNAPKIKGKGDIIFCVDVTGSMQPCIDGVKANIQSFVETLGEDGQSPMDWKAKVIGYRDIFVDSEYLVGLDNPWVSNAKGIVDQLSTLKADGGGDKPESLLDTLYTIIKETDWETQRHRIIIVFTDAPAKPEMSPDTVGSGADLSVNKVLDLAMEKRVKLYYFGPECNTLYPLEKHLPGSNMVYMESEGLAYADFDTILSQLAKTVSLASSRGVISMKSQSTQ